MATTVKGITDKNIVEEILRKGEVLRLAMCADGVPYVVPLNYGYAEGTVYVHTDTKGKKIDILKKNPRVCFEVTAFSEQVWPESTPAHKCGTRYRCVVGDAQAVFVEQTQDKLHGLGVIMRQYASDWAGELDEKVVKVTCVIRLDILSMTGRTRLD